MLLAQQSSQFAIEACICCNDEIQKRKVDAVGRCMHDLFDLDLTGSSHLVKAMYQSAQQEAQTSMAGEKLQQLRIAARTRAAKLYTGYLGRRRAWYGQPVILPGNIVGKLISIYRGFASVAWEDPFSVQTNRVSAFETETIQPYKNPAAVALGRLKLGRKERKSEAKKRAVRRNGCRPVRAGSRPRGRPLKGSAAVGQHVIRSAPPTVNGRSL
jgi:hypothetical protein